jgi:hypothetical protein
MEIAIRFGDRPWRFVGKILADADYEERQYEFPDEIQFDGHLSFEELEAFCEAMRQLRAHLSRQT